MTKMENKDIKKYVPHRYPFLLVDRVLGYTPGETIKAIKNVTINEPWFTGHFPETPVMPGVLLLEGMAQAGGILLLKSRDEREQKLMYLMTIEKARFRRPVVPGDQVHFEVEVLRLRRAHEWQVKSYRAYPLRKTQQMRSAF